MVVRKEHLLAIIMIVVVAISYFAQHAENVNRTKRIDEIATQRALDACRRENPGRAYFQIRAQEVDTQTAKSTGMELWTILNCRATVEQGGRPVPLPKQVQEQYIALFKSGLVPTTRGTRIVGGTPFEEYFAGKGPIHP